MKIKKYYQSIFSYFFASCIFLGLIGAVIYIIYFRVMNFDDISNIIKFSFFLIIIIGVFFSGFGYYFEILDDKINWKLFFINITSLPYEDLVGTSVTFPYWFMMFYTKDGKLTWFWCSISYKNYYELCKTIIENNPNFGVEKRVKKKLVKLYGLKAEDIEEMKS